MSAEQANLGFFAKIEAIKKKREQEFLAACVAMQSAINTLSLNISQCTDDETVDLIDGGAGRIPLLGNAKLTQLMAQNILDDVKKLQANNPVNTEFLTNVVNVTTQYIRNPTPENLGKYNAMSEQVATKYGRHAALTGLLFALPPSMIIGGIIGAAFLCVAFPAFIPLITVVSFVVAIAAAGVSTLPLNKAAKISTGWDGLKKELNAESPRPSFSK